MWYVHTVDYYSAIRKECNQAFAATWMDLEIILNEIRQEKDGYHMVSHMESEKKYKWAYLQNKNRPTDIENKLTVIEV